MTTSRALGMSADRTAAEGDVAPGAEGDVAPGAEGAVAVADARTRETAPATATAATATAATATAAPPADARHLEAEIRRTREQLGETVQELVARVDVKSRARAKTAQVSGRLKDTTSQLRHAVAKGAEGAREQWIPLTAAAGVLAVAAVVLSQWKRRQGTAGS